MHGQTVNADQSGEAGAHKTSIDAGEVEIEIAKTTETAAEENEENVGMVISQLLLAILPHTWPIAMSVWGIQYVTFVGFGGMLPNFYSPSAGIHPYWIPFMLIGFAVFDVLGRSATNYKFKGFDVLFSRIRASGCE